MRTTRQWRMAGRLFVAMAALGSAGRVLADPVFHFAFQDAAGNYSLTNNGTAGGVLTRFPANHTKLSESTDTAKLSPSTKHRSSYFAAGTGRDIQSAGHGVFEMPNNNTDTLTITAWVKHDGAQTAEGGIVGRGLDNNLTGWRFEILANNKLRFIRMRGSGGWSTARETVSAIPLNEWVHVAVTVGTAYDVDPDTGTAKRIFTLYVNGEVASGGVNHFVDGSFGNFVYTDLPIKIGSSSRYEQLHGTYVDDVRMFERVLTQVEIEAIWKDLPPSGSVLCIR